MCQQIHCAVASGNIDLLKWLIEKQYCLTKDVRTGEHLTTAAGHTLLAVAARKGDTTMMRYLLHNLGSSVLELTDVAVLQRGLHAALEVKTFFVSISMSILIITTKHRTYHWPGSR